MGKQNSIPRSDPENPTNRVDAAGASAGGETTLDTGGIGAAARAEDRMSIGPYALVRKLGEGGMGQVWLAEQTAPVKRQVALKLIKGGLYDSAVIQRFESERQSLAVMNHPAIAKVFDAGSTADGQPYFVMEYVEGLPITKYCDVKKLTIRGRLELFIQVCEGVQHAHQKAIIHRDLKPSNILVVEVDGKPVPRIIDFGLAKAISPQPGAEQTLFTQMGGLVGTRGFMSPEQADPSVLDVDTRTDVYSLGVILYVLLTGTLPFDPEQWKRKPFDEVLRQLREEDPPSPSTKLSKERETAKDIATNRGTGAKHLVALLHGDLDWITMKAVEKDRARRYGTPSELVGDLDRYLQNRPVMARPASTGYRLKKYVRRHLVGVAVASGAVALLVAFAVAQSVQLRRITRERDRANRITDFMTSMFKVSDPSEARGNSVTAREILDKASTDIDTGLAKDPELKAQMLHVMGTVYDSLGLYTRAESLLGRAVDIRRQFRGSRNSETLTSMDRLAWALNNEGRYPESEKLMREVVDIRRRVLGAEHPDTVESTDELAFILDREGRTSEGEQLQREVVNIRRRLLGPESLETAASMMHLANSLMLEGRYGDAEKLERETLDIRRRVLGPDNLVTLAAMHNLAFTLEREGRYTEAEKLDRQALDVLRRVQGSAHPGTLMTTSNLAWVLHQEGRYAEAEKLQREVVETGRRVLGPERPSANGWTGRLADDLFAEGRYPEAEKLQREDVDIRRRVDGPEHPETLLSMGDLALTLQYEGYYAEAEKLQRKTIEVQRRVLGPEHPDVLTTMGRLARTLHREGRSTEAEKLQREVVNIQHRVLGPDHPETSSSTYSLACIVAHGGNRDEALSLLRWAIDHGLSPADDLGIEKESDLKSLHGDPRFAALVAHAKERAAAQKAK